MYSGWKNVGVDIPWHCGYVLIAIFALRKPPCDKADVLMSKA
jgi:hypothetical protein